jgi:hypothetical protein
MEGHRDIQLLRGYQTRGAVSLAGMPVTAWPSGLRVQESAVQPRSFSMYPKQLTTWGTKLRGVVMNLTGGKRPVFELGFASLGARTPSGAPSEAMERCRYPRALVIRHARCCIQLDDCRVSA